MNVSPERGSGSISEQPAAEGAHDPDDEVVVATIEDGPVGPLPDLELPDDPEQAIAALVAELGAAWAAAAEAIDKWKRSVAEFENYRRRAARDQAEIVARSSERVMVRLLPALDSLDAAIAMESSDSAEPSMRRGMSSTRDLLLSTLASEGLTPIEALDTVFDPNLHEAAQMAEGSGTMVVVAELRRGYQLKGRVIRAALVAVGYEPVPSHEAAGDDQEQV